MSNKVFVVDAEGKPLLPTSPARARLLLKRGKADTECVIPFTIRLRRAVDNPVGSFGVGIDDGSKHVGVAIVNDVTKEGVFVGEIELRQDVKRLVRQRAQYRRSRRSRKLRCRKPRFDNRINKGLTPSIRARKDSIIRFVKDMQKRVNITHATVEEVRFNHVKHQWGKWFSLVEIGKMYLREQLNNLGLSVEVVEGWMTAGWRKVTNTSKSHGTDAAVILSKQDKVILPKIRFMILPRRSRVWEENPTRKYDERLGFQHWDIVKASRAGKSIIGCVRSLKAKVLTLRTVKDRNFVASYSKSRLLWRPDGLIYLPIV
jgi:hypothetical protein